MVVTFEQEYRYLEMLGPRATATLTRRCHGKWSAFDVLCHMRKKGWDPDDKNDDQKIADAILRQDRNLMGR